MLRLDDFFDFRGAGCKTDSQTDLQTPSPNGQSVSIFDGTPNSVWNFVCTILLKTTETCYSLRMESTVTTYYATISAYDGTFRCPDLKSLPKAGDINVVNYPPGFLDKCGLGAAPAGL